MGRKPDFIKSYPDEALLEELRRVAGLVGKPVLTKSDFTKHTGISADALARRFGGWRVALERAGAGHLYSGEAEGWKKRYSDEALLEEVRRVATLVEKQVLTHADFSKHSDIHSSTIAKRFGKWRTALERAGLGHMVFGVGEGLESVHLSGYSDEKMLAELRRVAGIVRKPVLTHSDFHKHSCIAHQTFKKRFGSWNAALDRAGLGRLSSRTLDVPENHPRARYSDDDLVAEICRVAEAVGKPVLTHGDCAKHSKISMDTIRRRFGSWHAGLERAGLSHMCAGFVVGGHTSSSHGGWPDEVLLDELRRVAGLVRKPTLLRADFANHSSIAPDTLARRFGSWHAALQRAGIGEMYSVPSVAGHTRHSQAPWPDEVLLAEICRVAQVVGKPVLTYGDFEKHSRIHVETVRQRFGAWHIALERAGLGHMCSRPPLQGTHAGRGGCSEEALLAEVRRVAKLVGKSILTASDFNRHAGITAGPIQKRFGTWQAALERAGVGHMYSGISLARYSDEELLEEIMRVAALVGKPMLTKNDFIHHSRIDVSTLRHRFGDWRAAFQRAGVRAVEGLQTKFQPKFTNEMLLEEVRRVARVVGKPVLTSSDFDKQSEIPVEAVRRRFGSWRAVLEEAGLSHMCSGVSRARHSDEELLAEVRRVARLVGKQTPTKKDFVSHSRISDSTIRKRFGDWAAASERAGVDDVILEK